MLDRLTITDVARKLNEPIHRVRYAVRIARIAPAGWVGNIRIFTPKQVAAIEAALRRPAKQEGVTANGT